MLMRINPDSKLFGYPWLVLGSVMHDLPQRRRR